MIRQIPLTLTILATLTVALLAGPPPATAESSQGDPDRLRTINLAAVAATFGDSSGHLVIRHSTGEREILARGLESPVIYRQWDELYTRDVFSFCGQDSSGRLVGCEEFDLSADGGGTEYCSDHPDGDNWCECEGLFECALLALSGLCTEDLDCEGTECACESD